MKLTIQRTNCQKAFTLIELLLVIGIIAILAAIVIVAINPTKQLEDARDAQRRSDVNQLEKAIKQYIIDGNELTFLDSGNAPMPDDIADALPICKELTGSLTDPTDCEDDGGYPLFDLTETYFVSLPIDPDGGTNNYTGYYIYEDGFNYEICNVSLDCECNGQC